MPLLPWQSDIASFAVVVVAAVGAIAYFLLSGSGKKVPADRATEPGAQVKHQAAQAKHQATQAKILAQAKHQAAQAQELYAEATILLEQKDMKGAKQKCDEALRVASVHVGPETGE
jgi:predicted lipid-binding transport protein (Tim44 family)